MKTLLEQITALKKERNSLILAHNYVDGEVQDAADFVGDSLELSIRARDARAELLIFCGVSFMAETAKLLSPGSRVLHPAPHAGCPMADMADAAAVRAYKEANPDTVLVAYVNTTAAVKAEVDICCTSANAEKVIQSIPADRPIMFLPDQNLGANVRNATGRAMALWPGYCPTHNRIMPHAIEEARAAYPNALLLVHPECTPTIVAMADYSLSTGGMLRMVRESAAKQFLIGSEHGIIHRMRKENPEKEFIPITPMPRCPNMKKLTLENLLETLQDLSNEVHLPAEMMERARLPIDRMLAL